MNTHPLSLYEIVLAIGQCIPLRESVHLAYEDVWLFKPKDLLAAISINRLFRTTLTPLLWSVFVESAVKSLGNAYECMGNEEYDIPIDSVQKNSLYIRFLDLSSYYRQLGRMRESPELYCSRLHELRLSSSVDSTWAKLLILANPELRVLHWARIRKKSSREKLKDFASILSLQRLRYLGLDDWIFLTEHLYRALAKNAGHLEELRLTRCDSILLKRSKRDDTSKSRYTVITSMETGVEDFETMEQMCKRIRLTKLKTLHLDVEHNRCPPTLYWLIDIAPALETAVFGDLLRTTGKALGLTLRHLVHASLRGLRLDNTSMEALSVHRDCHETLELDIRDDNYRDSFCNLGTTLEQCSQPKHLAVAVHFYREPCDRRQPLLFLDKLVTCPGLESLTFNGFRLAGENNHMHEGDEDYGSNEGTSRANIEWDPEFEDYHDPQAYIFWLSWREVYLAFGSDDGAGWCSAHFKRILRAFYGSIMFKVKKRNLKLAQNPTLNKAVGAFFRSCGIKGKWREGDERRPPFFVAGVGKFTSRPGRPIRHLQFFMKLKTKLEALEFVIVSVDEYFTSKSNCQCHTKSEDDVTMDRRSMQLSQGP
ncbi:hypothetical protein BKA57DRAFT_491711 [Linnemannia elongata]|nr:hypothetical protein BKA57DRAFT_491711 [Linnemannia elongata]